MKNIKNKIITCLCISFSDPLWDSVAESVSEPVWNSARFIWSSASNNINNSFRIPLRNKIKNKL
jgi:hypothetical protein